MADDNKKAIVSMSVEELQAMIAEGIRSALESGEAGGSVRTMRKVSDRRVEVRFINNKAVLGYANRGSSSRPLYVYTKPDPKDPRKDIEYVDLILEGMTEKDKPISVDWKEFRKESVRASCRISKIDIKEWDMTQGVVRKKEVEEYSSVELDFDVPLDVSGSIRLYTVEVPADFGGKRNITIHENYVNIA